jgi:hypothetical protein
MPRAIGLSGHLPKAARRLAHREAPRVDGM